MHVVAISKVKAFRVSGQPLTKSSSTFVHLIRFPLTSNEEKPEPFFVYLQANQTTMKQLEKVTFSLAPARFPVPTG